MSGGRAVLYLRLSEDRDGEAAGIARQREDCQALAAREGWRIVGEYVDNGKSAYSGRPRPAFEQLLADVATYDVVVCWATDRLYRQMGDLTRITKDLAPHARIAAVKGGEVDLGSAEGILRAQMLGSVAEFESRRKGERVARRAEQRAGEGKFSGGQRPYGYEPDGVRVRECEATHLRAAYDAITGGLSLAETTRRVTAAGATTSTGRPWTPNHLRLVLLSPRYAGLSSHRGVVVGDAVWPGVVDRDTWETARTILTDPARRTTPGSAPRHLLSGVTFCGREGCGKPCRVSVTGGRDRARRYVYRCPHGHVIRAKDRLEGYVVQVTLGLLEREGIPALLAADQDTARAVATREAAEAAERLRERLEALSVDYAAGLVTREQLHAGTASLRARIAEAEDVMAGSTRGRALAVMGRGTDMASTWAGLDLDTQRSIMRELWRITLVPQPTGKPGVHAEGVRLDPVYAGA